MNLSPEVLDLVVVGGGAAGFFAAITCAEGAPPGSPPLRILILEKAKRPLRKVLVSGGGRCNVTHACYDPAQLVQYYPRGGSALRSAFTRFQPGDIIAWLEKRGVALKTEPDGRIFPVSDTSQSIVACLMDAARQAGVELLVQIAASSIVRMGDSGSLFQIRLRTEGNRQTIGAPSQGTLLTRRLLLATGGDPAVFDLVARLGHTLAPPVPSLFTFAVHDPRLDGLAGVSVPSAALQLWDENDSPPKAAGMKQEGALLITHWGVSGPAVLRLSAWGARWLYERGYRAVLAVNWLHPLSAEGAQASMQRHKRQAANARQKAAAYDPFQRLPQRLWKRLVHAAGIHEGQNWGDLSNLALRRLAEELTRGRYAVRGKGPFREEFVTCGGVLLDEVDFKTMESRRAPGLYFAGELLDVDGLTGGFNFQNAWTTGWIAGSAIADSLLPVTHP